ncbi:MAG: M23 family metallopeptidase [Ardenticatenaceae bacterium]|nr:M23 family metallopeptidase [Ardenticatenaceae bacterium]MCB8947782.1 M23 family metallopeptidase [Ardenticatenaceae bacterium]
MSDFKFEVWPTEFRQINQYFGQNPNNYAQFGLPGHEGLDLMAPTGSKIFAVAPGTVRVVNAQPNNHNYGIHVRVDHVDGWQTIYAHLQQATVRVGEPVKAGDQLGLADNTGNSFGSHLHLTLKRQNASYTDNSGTKWPYNIFDPTPFLLPLLGWQRPAGPYTDGWAYTDGVIIVGDLAQVNSGGINLRANPSIVGTLIDLVPGGTIVIVTGAPRGQYTPVKVANASLTNVPTEPPPTPVPPDPTDNLVNGWAFTTYITRAGNQAIVGQYGINLRAAPSRTATNMGLVKGGSTLSITGSPQGEYTPVAARRVDFSGPVNIPDEVAPPIVPTPDPDPEPTPPPTDAILGWAYTQNLTINGRTVISGRFGTNLRAAPVRGGSKLGLFIEGGTGTLAGQSSGEYTPVWVSRSSLRNIPSPLPPITQPTPLPGDSTPPPPPPQPISDTTPGWAFTAAITVSGGMANAGQYGINLRAAPRRDAEKVGFVPGNASMIVTGAPQGEYTPVRVDDNILQDTVTGPVAVIDTLTPPDGVFDPEPPVLGDARLGLHASADPGISQAEIEEFADMRPGMIKVLSFHEPTAVQKLSQAHPDARWIVRAFLEFRTANGVRNISPGQFLNDTVNDVRRTLEMIGPGRDVVIELHNEPNLVPEGLTGAWNDGASFAEWWLEVLRLYRQALPGRKFIYPGLSPGSAVSGIKQDHIQFVEASRAAVEAADGLGIHTYWSNVYPMQQALNVLDDYISRFRYKPIWITEASNNKAGTPVYMKAQQYLDFWREIQKRPTVQGVTYFVASASNPAFKEEVWVGRDIGKRVGRR